MIVNPDVPRVVEDEGNSEELWELATCNLPLIFVGVPHERALTKGNENFNHRFHRFTQIFLFSAYSASLRFRYFRRVVSRSFEQKRETQAGSRFTFLSFGLWPRNGLTGICGGFIFSLRRRNRAYPQNP